MPPRARCRFGRTAAYVQWEHNRKEATMRRSTLILLAALAASAPAAAGTFTVNSEADVPDDAIGDGECHAELGLPGVCTLRAAIQEANAHAGSDLISLTAGQHYTLTRSGQDDTASRGDLDITDDTTILFFASGERPVVDAGGVERAFDIREGNVTMLGFDVTGGDATVAGDAAGGGIAIDFDAGTVQLSLLRLYGNRASFGAGVYNDGPSTTVSASELYDNEIQDDFVDSSGAAIFNRGTLTVDHSSVYENSGVGAFGSVAIENTPPFVGSPTLTLIDSTVAENVGIGINSQDESTLVVRNATIAANTTTGVRIGGPGGTFQMRNSVIAKNGDQDCVISVAAELNLDRYNMDSDDSCALADGSSNYPGVEPFLTPPVRRGGFGRVSWPLTMSPMIEQGHPVIGAIGCEDDDQDFLERPADFDGDGTARCDVGAVELSADVIFFDPMERL
jgi:CSLREA domain-containing protein